MITTVLKNIAYQFYPKNICSTANFDKYLKSSEYIKLKILLDSFHNESNNIFNEFTNEFNPKYNFDNQSRLQQLDRCFTFNLSVVKDGELHSIVILISVISPYYTIRNIKHKTINYFLSELEKKELEKKFSEITIKNLILEIEHILDNKFKYNKFPDELKLKIIENINFQDSHLNHFTMFNAFFNNTI